MDEFPAQDGHDEDGDADVGSDKVGCVPVSFQENREAGDQCDDCRTDETEPSGIWLQRSHPGQRLAADALRLEPGVKADVTETERRPCD